MKPLMLGAGQLFVLICSCERDECDRCNYMKIINHKELRKWNQMKNDPCSCECNKYLCNYVRSLKIKREEWAKVSRECGTYGLGFKPSGSWVTNINSLLAMSI